MILAALCVLVLMLLIYSGMQINRLNSEVNDLTNQLTAQRELEKTLKKDVDERINIDEIQKVAIEDLNMVKIDTVEHVYIDLNSGDAVDLHNAARDPELLAHAFDMSFGQ